MTEQPVGEYEEQLRWATVDMVHLNWIDGTPPMEDDVIAYQLWQAEDKILSEFPDVQRNIDNGLIRESTVARVAVSVAMRRLTNPGFQRSQQRGAGPFSMNTTIVGGDHPGEIYLNDSDRDDLTPKRGRRRRAAGIMPRY
jgi:hypothetical protein